MKEFFRHIFCYFPIAGIFVAALSLLYLPILLAGKKRGKPPLRMLVHLAFGCSCFLILFGTVLFSGIDFDTGLSVCNLQPLHWLHELNADDALADAPAVLAQVVANVLVFIPLGLFVAMEFPRLRRVTCSLLTVVLVSLSIETFQYWIGRSADIDDLIANTIGGLLGYAIYRLLDRLLYRKAWWKTACGAPVTG